MEKRKVTISIGGRACSFYSDDSDEYISLLEERANAVMKQTARFSGSSSYANAVLSVLFLTDQLLRTEQTEKPQAEKPPAVEHKGSKKNTGKAPGKDNGQVSVWDLLDDL